MHSTKSEYIVSGRPLATKYDWESTLPAEISLEQRFAERLGLKLGDLLTFNVQEVPVEAKSFKMEYVDATCPLVSKVHREAENLNKNGLQILLIGHKNHPEVTGTMGQIPEGEIDLIENIDDANNYQNKSNKKLAFVTQTTLSAVSYTHLTLPTKA